jgi:hypothetical protein
MNDAVNKIMQLKRLRDERNKLEEEIREEAGISVTVYTYSVTITGKMLSLDISSESIKTITVCSSNMKQPETPEEFEAYLKAKKKEEAELTKLANKIKKEIWEVRNDE